MTGRGVPVVLVTGVCADTMDAATVGLQWDLPAAVVVQHRIDVESQQLHRSVSDVSGLLEREVTDLGHACVSCAVREDILPTLRRLADIGRWGAVIARLPVAAEALQVCRLLAHEQEPGLFVSAVVTALDGPAVVETLTGDQLLCEQGRHTSTADRRGVAETAAALVEYADIISVHGSARPDELALVRTLARPGAVVVGEQGLLPTSVLLDGVHDHASTEAWVDETRAAALSRHAGHGVVWRLDLRSDRPFHPQRLHEQLSAIGSGPHRSRGCFWLPSRPGQACAWDGAGGQVSVGALGDWRGRTPMVRLVVAGLEALTPPHERAAIETAFSRALLTDTELADRGAVWELARDGFEPWLGDIRTAA